MPFSAKSKLDPIPLGLTLYPTLVSLISLNLSGTVLFQSYLEHITRNIKEYCLPTVSFMLISLNHPKNLPNICYSYHKTTISITSTSYGKTQDVSSTPNSCVVCVPWCTWRRTSPCGIATLIDGGVVRTLVSIRPKIRME